MKKGLIALAATIVAMAAVLGSCSTQKKGGVQTSGGMLPENMQQRFENTVATYTDWDTFKASGTVTIGGKSPFSSAMQITMVRGKSVNVSIRPLLGIEMGRIYITGDSIVVVNKVEKYYIAENLTLIAGGIPMNINDMQNLLLSRMFELGNGTITTNPATLKSITEGANNRVNVTLQPKGMDFAYTFALNSEGEVRGLSLEAGDSPVNLSVTYSAHQATDYGKVASNVVMSSRFGEQDMQLTFELNPAMLWNQSVSDRSPIDTRYRRIDGMALLKGMFR